MLAHLPDSVILWLFNGVITIISIFGGWYIRRLKEDIKEIKDEAKAAKTAAAANATALLEYKITALQEFSRRTDVDTTKTEIIEKLNYLTQRIDTIAPPRRQT